MFVVFLSSQSEKAKAFYERLGLAFHAEKHGGGPEHLAARMGDDAVLEIYPPMTSAALRDTFYIAATVDDPATEKRLLIETFGGSEAEPPIPTTASGIATLRDPDDRLVRLFRR